MEIFRNPQKQIWSDLIKRPVMTSGSLSEIIHPIFDKILLEGDKAVYQYTLQFDKVLLSDMEVSYQEVEEANNLLSQELKEAILQAKRNIETFHKSQIETVQYIETMPGVTCWRRSLPIESVGLYIPGGTAPLFSSVLMLAVPAHLAGCKELILCSPPNKEGKLHPAIIFAASLAGVTKMFKVGGIQAIAALTLGTESIPQVNKIFGPGNQYVTAAKQESLKFGIAIDLPAGPSELLIIADTSTPPEFIASDLLSQAEHGTDSQVILLSDKASVINKTMEEVQSQLQALPRKEIAEKALRNSKAIELKSIDECIEFSNQYAPEHLILATDHCDSVADKITNAGSVFLGPYSCESIGDYASGTNHTLPTYGYAKNYSGVSLDSFVKKVTYQKITAQGIQNIGPITELMADAEHLFAHKNAVSIRLNHLKNN